MKKKSKSSFIPALIFILIIAAVMLVQMLIAYYCEKTNSLLLILLDTSFNGAFYTVTFLTVIILSVIVESFKTCLSDIKAAIHHPFFKKYLIGVLLFLLASQLFPFSKGLRYIETNGKRPIRLQYHYYLISDALSNDTDTVTMNAKDFKIERHTYTTRIRHKSYRHTAYYACFDDYSVYLYQTSMRNYIKACQQYQKDIEVEYYKKSGIIKTIDGVELYDENKFNELAAALEKAEFQKQAEEAAIKEEEDRKSLELFKAFFESEGKNYNTIAEKLKRDDIENTYDVIYISTNYYDVGDVALFDNTQNVIYVVRDNEKEDMVEVPYLTYNETFDEITKLLDDSGIKWKFDCFGSHSKKDELNHSKDILNTVHCGSGTPIPKDYVFWFSVTHAD